MHTAVRVPQTGRPRPAIRELVKLLRFRATYGRPSYVKFASKDAALIVPHLTDGPDGPYSFLRGFRRETVDEAATLGLIVLGQDRVNVPPIGANHWAAQPELKGRTIALSRQTTTEVTAR